jgi:hypothetical protein
VDVAAGHPSSQEGLVTTRPNYKWDIHFQTKEKQGEEEKQVL